MNEVATDSEVIAYPDSDGKPMADNTLQWEWMVRIVGELREQFKDQNVFVAGDLFWYPVQGSPRIVAAPDALVVFGRPPGYRGSYKQWEEENIAPQVVFEVLSPCNTDEEMDLKHDLYELHGVQEYYVIDPYLFLVEGYFRRGNRLRSVRKMNGFVSPLLKTRFEMKEDSLVLYGPDGRAFQDREERVQEILEELHKTSMAFEEEHSRAIEESKRADEAESRADEAEVRAERERTSKELLAKKLRELGLNPDELLRSAG